MDIYRLCQTENVFLFVPNIIGYGRIVLAIISFYYMPTSPVCASFCYFLSGILDAADGYAARYLNQCSRFGAMLDQLTDRCATLALLIVLGHFYPKYLLAIQLFAIIDIASHWLHLHSHDLKGSGSHKSVDANTNPVLKLYYTSRPFLFFMCFGNEAFLCFLYLAHFGGPVIPLVNISLWSVIATVFFPVSFVKTVISLFHLITAAQSVAEHDVKHRGNRTNKQLQ